MAEMALQMQQPQPGNGPQLLLLDRVHPRRAVPQTLERVFRHGAMDGDPLVPVGPVDLEPVRVRH